MFSIPVQNRKAEALQYNSEPEVTGVMMHESGYVSGHIGLWEVMFI